jgi:hypothetical protein
MGLNPVFFKQFFMYFLLGKRAKRVDTEPSYNIPFN